VSRAAGDVLFFNYLTVHGSGINRSPRTRKTVLVQVRDPLDLPLSKNHRSHAQGMMLRGIDPLALGQTTAEGTLGSPWPRWRRKRKRSPERGRLGQRRMNVST